MALPIRSRKFGPGMLVAAAFIGPGTVTAASKAGAEYGFQLGWTVVFSVIATVVLQEMAARLGLVSRRGLGEAIRSFSQRFWIRLGAVVIVSAAIGFGNAAYQTGNIVGAAVGLNLLAGGSVQFWAIVIGSVAFALLFSGRYRWLEVALIGLVLLMSLLFLVTAVLVRPSLEALAEGCLVPHIPSGSLLTVIGLIGTTVVPYNLFLHASSVCQKWPDSQSTDTALRESRLDTVSAVFLGGLITLAIMATAAATFHGHSNLTTAAEMARQLEPLLGSSAARIFFAGGLLAAGLTSAITAPLAAAFAVSGALGTDSNLRSWSFRCIWLTVLIAGTTLAAAGMKSPQITIMIAQAANGCLLPLVSMFLLLAVNRKDLMKQYRNGMLANLVAVIVVLTTLLLSATAIYKLCS